MRLLIRKRCCWLNWSKGGRELSIKERVARLIDVKSLVTLALVAVLCGMTICGKETEEIFNSSVMLVLGFFFGKNLKPNESVAVLDEVKGEE